MTINNEEMVLNNNPLEILDDLLKEITQINVREFLNLPDDKNIAQKDNIVASITHLLKVAKDRNWNLAKVYDYVYLYNGAFWQELNKEDLKLFLGKAAVKMGFPEHEVMYYEFKDRLLRQFQSQAYLPSPPKNEETILINLQNGTMEFNNNAWTLRGFSSNDFMTYQLPFSYEKDATCTIFKKYLDEVLPDKKCQKVLQEFSGYIFTNLNLEKMLMLVGNGANGKSVFFNIISAIVGENNILNYSLGLFSHEYNRAKLTNKLLNYSSEKGTDLNPETFKALVSGEPVQAREPYGKSFTLKNSVRFIVNANELPQETEQTNAFFRRYLIIPFDVTIPIQERDIDLSDKIIKNELPGVFNWVLQGLERIVDKRKFTDAKKSEQALADFKVKSDSVTLFINEIRHEETDPEKIVLGKLYDNYKEFCYNEQLKRIGRNKFSSKLEKKGFEKTRTNNGSTAFILEFKTD